LYLLFITPPGIRLSGGVILFYYTGKPS